MIGWSVCGQVSVSDGDGQDRAILQKHKLEITQACDVAVTNILHELEELAKQYPPLSDIGLATIEKGGSANSGNNRLYYEKNIRRVPVQLLPGTPGAQLAQTAGQLKLVIDKDGALLKIVIRNANDMAFFKDYEPNKYPLMVVGQKSLFFLAYDLQLSSPDSVLEKSVRDTIEKQAGTLRNTFQNILGIDPAAEKAQAYGSVMTNILVGLQGLAQHISILDDIENKGPQYVYQHLHYWKNAHVATTNDALPYQAPPPMDIPFVEKGGIALDVYLRNEDEPFGFRPDGTYSLVSPDRKTQLNYSLYFNRHENLVQDSKVLMDINPNKAIEEVVENQREILRKKLDDIIDF